MTSREYLKEYNNLLIKQENKNFELELINQNIKNMRLEPGTAFYNHFHDQKKTLENDINTLEEKKENIIDNINRLKNATYRKILYYRYIKLLSWEDVTAAINEDLEKPQSKNNIKQYAHNKALEVLQNILDQEAENI